MADQMPEVLSDYHRPDVLRAVKPVGLEAVRHRVLEDVTSGALRTARWEYGEDNLVDRAESALSALDANAVDPMLESAVRLTLEEDRFTEAMLRDRTDESLSEWSAARYPDATDHELEFATAVLASHVDEPAGKLVGTEVVVGRIAEVLSTLDLDGWQAIAVDELAARASVNASEKTVKVRRGVAFTEGDVVRLIAHEIGGHVFRSANAELQLTPFARLPLGEPVESEEGVAIWAEARLGVLRPPEMRQYAARLRAVALSRTEGVLEIARHLVADIGLGPAVDAAIRVKRGLRDPNNPGGIAKDIGYLRGLLRVRSRLEDEPELVPLIYATKWSLDHIPLTQHCVERGLLRLDHLRLPGATLLGCRS